MLKFTSKRDLSQINIANPAYQIIATLVTQLIAEASETYDPEEEGFIALIEPGDTEFCGNGTWKDVRQCGDTLIALYQFSNECAIICVIPNINHCITIH